MAVMLHPVSSSFLTGIACLVLLTGIGVYALRTTALLTLRLRLGVKEALALSLVLIGLPGALYLGLGSAMALASVSAVRIPAFVQFLFWLAVAGLEIRFLMGRFRTGFFKALSFLLTAALQLLLTSLLLAFVASLVVADAG